MAISSIPEDDSVIIPGNMTRERAYSHTRTNSSSSSASSLLSSPTAFPINQSNNGMNNLGRMIEESESDSSTTTTTANSTSFQMMYQTSASEAAAVAAVRNTVNSVQIQSKNRSRVVVPLPHQQTQQMPISTVQHKPYHSSSFTKDSKPPTVHHNKFSAAAAAFAAKPKESALSKAKMFARSAKPHLSSSNSSMSLKDSSKKHKNVDLTINTKQLPPGRSSLSERSPMARPSKELERIASIGNIAAGDSNSGRKEDKPHKHHISFRSRKESHGGVVLSSSSSNSKLISDNSIYSFHPSSPGMAAIDVKNLNTKEDRDMLADESWSLLCSRVMPLFMGEGLRVPVEDLNNVLLMHLNFFMQQGGTAKEIINEFKILLRTGMYNLDPTLHTASDDQLVPRLVDAWMTFFLEILSYLEAVFLPLQAEFEGAGQVLTAKSAHEYWLVLLEKDGKLNSRRYLLMSFRDTILIPIADRLMALMKTRPIFDFEGSEVTDLLLRLLQCMNVLASIQSGDENQERVDSLVKALHGSWMAMSRTGKDRRGFIFGARH